MEVKEIIEKVAFPVEFAGKFEIHDKPFYDGKNILEGEDVGYEKAKLNARLICEAFNVANQTGMTPSTLHSELEKQKYLYKGLKELGDERISKLQAELEKAREVIESLSGILEAAGHDLWLEHSGATTFLNEGKK